MGLRFALLLMLLGQFLPFTAVRANAQNLGTAPAFNKAVQGQQATTVEGTVLNIDELDLQRDRPGHRHCLSLALAPGTTRAAVASADGLLQVLG